MRLQNKHAKDNGANTYLVEIIEQNKGDIVKRNIGIDITRIIAFICVPAVHFLLHIGYYDRDINCARMYFMTGMRTLFTVCVPLFLIISGYLMSGKRIGLTYSDILSFYKKISKVIIIYLICAVVIVVSEAVRTGNILTVKNGLLQILSFNVGYSWYVEMYIGLFLMVPFLNAIWNSLQEHKARACLVIVLLFLTMLPSVLNIWDLSSVESLIHPVEAKTYNKLTISSWTALYPVSYYFIGAYIHAELKPKMFSTFKLITVTSLLLVAFCGFNIWRSYNSHFNTGAWIDWGGFIDVILATLIFVIINNFDYSKLSSSATTMIEKIANLTFGAYLLSVIPDLLIYGLLNERVPIITKRLDYFFVTVPVTIVVSLLLSWGVEFFYRNLNCIKNSR